MSDSAQALRRKPDLFFLVAGLASSLLCMSAILSFAFLLPVQIAYGRRGGREGIAAAAVSALCISVATAAGLAATGIFARGASRGLSAPIVLAGSIAIPLLFLLALALINAPIAPRRDNAYRILGVTALCVLIAGAALMAVERNDSVIAFMEGELRTAFDQLRGMAGGSAGGYDASVLEAVLEPKEWLAMIFALLRNSIAAILFTMLAGSWWLGNRMCGKGSRGWEGTTALDELRLPYPFLWGFLLSWTYALVTVLLKAQGRVSEVAWNCALVFGFAYAGAGLGIVSYLLKNWNVPKSMRICLAILAVVAFASPYGMAVVVTLSLIGVTEIWIHYRKPKGVGI
jgi:hypothetical protein